MSNKEVPGRDGRIFRGDTYIHVRTCTIYVYAHLPRRAAANATRTVSRNTLSESRLRGLAPGRSIFLLRATIAMLERSPLDRASTSFDQRCT